MLQPVLGPLGHCAHVVPENREWGSYHSRAEALSRAEEGRVVAPAPGSSYTLVFPRGVIPRTSESVSASAAWESTSRKTQI